jgi:hypothetical protein
MLLNNFLLMRQLQNSFTKHPSRTSGCGIRLNSGLKLTDTEALEASGGVLQLPLMKIKFLFLILFLAPYQVFALTLPDTIAVQASSGAWVSLHEPSGLKAYEAGIVDAAISHSFSDATFCRVAVRGTLSLTSPFFEEASIGWRYKRFSGRGGMLSTHVGRATLYKPFSAFNPLVRSSVVWDSYGFGFGLDQRVGNGAISGAATINSRENGSALIMWTAVDNGVVCQRLLAGVQTQELDNQDNSVTFGDDVVFTLRSFEAHVAIKYAYYQGWGNNTMKPGSLAELFAEARLIPLQELTLSGCVYFKEFNKAYYSNLLREALDAQYMLWKWIGVYGGYEFQKSMETVTHVPEIGLACAPLSGRALIRVGWESSIVGASNIDRIIGLVWLAF